jgi:competence ComEA-like helix-hairpin-helix protein
MIKSLKIYLRQFFDFSEKETNGFFILTIILLLLVFAPLAINLAANEQQKNSVTDAKILDSLMLVVNASFNQKNVSEPFKKDSSKLTKTSTNSYKTTYKRTILKQAEKFDINFADSLELDKVYGIGFKTATRIIKYRDKLGGFVNMNQLYEVWGLDTIVVQELHKKSFISEQFTPLRININKADFSELKDHPYIGYKLAKVIIAFRNQHGNFHGEQQLREIKIITESDIEKLKPYLEYLF